MIEQANANRLAIFPTAGRPIIALAFVPSSPNAFMVEMQTTDGYAVTAISREDAGTLAAWIQDQIEATSNKN